MGGWGSGRPEYANTPTVEECYHLEVGLFTDLTEASTGTYADLAWSDTAEIRAYILNDGDGEHAEALQLTYTTNPDTDRETEYEYRVEFDYTEPHFGGVRPWFECPTCGERRGKLYIPPRGGRFRCRECHDLGYTSSRASRDPVKQAELRYRRAFEKADAENRRPHPNAEPFLPTRPKGMHHDTFDELMQSVEAAREEWEYQHLDQLRQRLNTLTDAEIPEPPPPFTDHVDAEEV